MSANCQKLRLDQALVERGLIESREKAQRAIMAGLVRVDGQKMTKAGMAVKSGAQVEVTGQDRYVGRGGRKLEGALEAFGVDPSGWTCLDVGASTGGFTDCLLQHGAVRVYAIDVGHNQLAWKIRSDPRVVAQEGVNARFLTHAEVPEPIDLAVADVSFISLTLILPPAVALLSSGGKMIVLIKPQFELARDQIGKGGVVRDPSLHDEAVGKIERFVSDSGLAVWRGAIPSPITGAKGNREFLACLEK